MGFEVFPIMLFLGIPFFALWTHHKRKILEIELRLHNPAEVGSGLRAEVEALRQEVRGLRDTTTQYDLSFDSALQRMEGRVEGIDRRIQSIQSEDVPRVTSGR